MSLGPRGRGAPYLEASGTRLCDRNSFPSPKVWKEQSSELLYIADNSGRKLHTVILSA